MIPKLCRYFSSWLFVLFLSLLSSFLSPPISPLWLFSFASTSLEYVAEYASRSFRIAPSISIPCKTRSIDGPARVCSPCSHQSCGSNPSGSESSPPRHTCGTGYASARVPQYSVSSVSSANGSQKLSDLSSFLDPSGRPLSHSRLDLAVVHKVNRLCVQYLGCFGRYLAVHAEQAARDWVWISSLSVELGFMCEIHVHFEGVIVARRPVSADSVLATCLWSRRGKILYIPSVGHSDSR